MLKNTRKTFLLCNTFFFQHIQKQAQHKSGIALAPALIESYARLLVYTEIESIGIKTFISKCEVVYFCLYVKLFDKNVFLTG